MKGTKPALSPVRGVPACAWYQRDQAMRGEQWWVLRCRAVFSFRASFCRKLLLTVDTTDENFMPKRVAVYGGEGDNLKKLNDVGIDE